MSRELTMENTILFKDWKSKDFEKCLEKVTYPKKIKTKKFLNKGLHPIISQEKEKVNGYWENSDDLFEVSKPVVIFGDHTKILKYIDFDFVLGADGVKILLANQNLNSRYLFYFLHSIKLRDLGYARHYRLLKEIQVLYPESLPQQKQIVATLDKAFAAIDTAKANAEQNLKYAKELFESYLQNVFENKGDDWKTMKLVDVCIVERGSSPRPIKKYITDDENGVNWIKIGDTKNIEKYIYETNQKITKEGAVKSRFVEEGDFILSNSMSFGKPYIMKTQGYIHDGWFRLKLHDFIDTEYFYQLLSSPLVNDQFHDLASGSVVKNISGDLVKKVNLPIPPLPKQRQIVDNLNAISAESKKLEAIYTQKIADLEEMKKSVLQKAFSGQLNTVT